MENPGNMQALDENLMEQVSGGSGADDRPYQLYYRGMKLPMDSTVGQICKMYSELLCIFPKLGVRYFDYAYKTLNQLCESYGELWIQNLINENR